MNQAEVPHLCLNQDERQEVFHSLKEGKDQGPMVKVMMEEVHLDPLHMVKQEIRGSLLRLVGNQAETRDQKACL